MTDREQAVYLTAACEEVAHIFKTSASNIAYRISDQYPGEYHNGHLDTTSKDFLKYAVAQTVIRLQVEDVLVTNWISVKDDDYRKALNDLITYNIQLHDDPAVSETAKTRQDDLQLLKDQNSRCQGALIALSHGLRNPVVKADPSLEMGLAKFVLKRVKDMEQRAAELESRNVRVRYYSCPGPVLEAIKSKGCGD